MKEKSTKLNIAGIQMVSSAIVEDNLNLAIQYIELAVRAGVKLVALPEYFCLLGLNDSSKLEHAEKFGNGPIQNRLKEQAKKHGIYVIGGSLPLQSKEAGRIYNSCLVFNPLGECVLRYDKIHLFSFQQGEERYDEATTIVPGVVTPPVFTTEWGVIGLGICYDLRFPEMFRAMPEIDLLVLPSAFTYTTGRAHWQLLLQARAIENQCYVLAPAQGGLHQNGRRTWGHSMIIDPWGQVLTSLPSGNGLVQAEIDLNQVRTVRQRLPALRHRRSGFMKDED